MVDTFVINYLFWYVFPSVGSAEPRPLGWVTSKAVGEYVIKFLIAVGLTPAVYALHELVVRKLGIHPHPHAPAGSSARDPRSVGGDGVGPGGG